MCVFACIVAQLHAPKCQTDSEVEPNPRGLPVHLTGAAFNPLLTKNYIDQIIVGVKKDISSRGLPLEILRPTFFHAHGVVTSCSIHID